MVRFLQTRGRGKVLFGTDFPALDYGDSIAAIDALELREAAKQSLLSGAARQIFKIK
jgi:predicted TIM-barrel fold metal-dependent hydrolase